MPPQRQGKAQFSTPESVMAEMVLVVTHTDRVRIQMHERKIVQVGKIVCSY